MVRTVVKSNQLIFKYAALRLRIPTLKDAIGIFGVVVRTRGHPRMKEGWRSRLLCVLSNPSGCVCEGIMDSLFQISIFEEQRSVSLKPGVAWSLITSRCSSIVQFCNKKSMISSNALSSQLDGKQNYLLRLSISDNVIPKQHTLNWTHFLLYDTLYFFICKTLI